MINFRRTPSNANKPVQTDTSADGKSKGKRKKLTPVKASFVGLAVSMGLVAPAVVAGNNATDTFERASEVITAGNAVEQTINNNPDAYAELLDSGIRGFDLEFTDNENVEDVLQQLSYDDKTFIAVDLYLHNVSSAIFEEDPSLALAFNNAVDRGLLNDADARFEFVQKLDELRTLDETEAFLKNVLNTTIQNNLEGSPDDQTLTLQRMNQAMTSFFDQTNQHVEAISDTFFLGLIGGAGIFGSLVGIADSKAAQARKKRREKSTKNEITLDEPIKR